MFVLLYISRRALRRDENGKDQTLKAPARASPVIKLSLIARDAELESPEPEHFARSHSRNQSHSHSRIRNSHETLIGAGAVKKDCSSSERYVNYKVQVDKTIKHKMNKLYLPHSIT